jgi:hypothetical protein
MGGFDEAGAAFGTGMDSSSLLDVHRRAEVPQQLFGATPAGVVFDVASGFAVKQFAVLEGHGAPAHPVVAIVDVNVVELGHASRITDAEVV